MDKLASSIEELQKTFNTRMKDYEDKLQKATSKDSPQHPDLTSLSQDYADFKSFVCETFNHLKNQIELVSLSLDRHETIMRRKVLLFHGVEEKPNEKLHDVVIQLFKRLKLPELSADNIEVCHRLGGIRGKTTPILVRFLNMEHRRLVWDSKTSLKGSGITISEFLTKTRHRVFMTARRHFGVKYCWSSEGKIVILTSDKTRHRITSMGELDTLMARFPANESASDDNEQSGIASSVAASKSTTSKTSAKAPPKRTRR